MTVASSERGTLRFYETNAENYAKQTLAADLSEINERFARHLRPGASILDVGCGAGRDLHAFRLRGFSPVGLEPSAALAEIARSYTGCRVTVGRVEDMTYASEFDGAWACASLLHLPRHRFPVAMKRIAAAVKTAGPLFLSMQQGVGEFTAPDGRFYSLYQPDALALAVETAGLELVEVWDTGDSLGDRPIRWINLIARVVNSHL